MKIKSKLMISFLIIILVPVLLSCAVLAGFHNFQIKAINESYGITDSEEMWLTNSVLLLKKVTERIMQNMQNWPQMIRISYWMRNTLSRRMRHSVRSIHT